MRAMRAMRAIHTKGSGVRYHALQRQQGRDRCGRGIIAGWTTLTALYYTHYNCTHLFYTCSTLFYTVLHCSALFYTVLHCSTLKFTYYTRYDTIPRDTTRYYTILHLGSRRLLYYHRKHSILHLGSRRLRWLDRVRSGGQRGGRCNARSRRVRPRTQTDLEGSRRRDVSCAPTRGYALLGVGVVRDGRC